MVEVRGPTPELGRSRNKALAVSSDRLMRGKF
jgi:hypothetical protein